MAYMSQEKKAKIKALLDPIMKNAKLKYSLAVRNHSTIVCNIKSGPVDFIGNHHAVMHDAYSKHSNEKYVGYNFIDVNPYWYQDHFTGQAKEIITNIIKVMNTDNHDRSDVMTDYFDVGHYVDVNIGTYDKPYELTK